jgi:hypothetical protein
MDEPRKFYTYKSDLKLTRAQVGVYFSAVQHMQQQLEEAIMRGKQDQGFPEAMTVINYIKNLKGV